MVLCLPWDTFKLALLIPTVILYAISIMVTFYGFYRNLSDLKYAPISLKVSYYCCIFFILMGSGGMMGFQIMPITEHCIYRLSYDIVAIGMAQGGYVYGLLSLYFLILMRLNMAFETTIFALNKITFFSLIFCGFLQFIPATLSIIFYALEWTETQERGQLAEYIFYLFYVICSAVLLTLFVYKIYKSSKSTTTLSIGSRIILPVTKSNSATSASSKSASTSPKAAEMSSIDIIHIQQQHVHNILDPAIKYAICASISFASTLGLNFILIYRAYIVDEDSLELLYYTLMLEVLDMTINVITLNLQFTYASVVFNALCTPCSNSCVKLLSNTKDSQTEQENTKETQKQQNIEMSV